MRRIERAKGFVEFREEVARKLPVLIYERDKLVLIDFVKHVRNLRLGDLHPFKETRQAAIDRLTEMSTSVFEDFEGYHFLDFGLTLSSVANFRENANIAVTRRRYYDRFRREQLAKGRGRYLKGGD